MEKNQNTAQCKGFNPTELLCEYEKNPLGIDTLSPRFSWKACLEGRNKHQTAYQIFVGSSLEFLTEGSADLWDSGRVESSQSVNVTYGGKSFASRQRYFWKVKLWDEAGCESEYSELTWFETALLRSEDWKAKWIGCSSFGATSPMFRKEFQVEKKLFQAKAYIVGLGHYELNINGHKVGDHVLDPAWTDYSKRILYSTYDVTNCLSQGNNAVGIMLGKGWFSDAFLHVEQPALQMIMQIDIVYEDGTKAVITSDTKSEWMVTNNGPVTFNSIYDGEVYDSRLEMPGWDTVGFKMSASREKGQDWKKVILMEAPGGRLISQTMEPIKIVMDIKPISLRTPASGVYVYDLGQNISGWVKLKLEGPSGTKVIMRYSELLYEDGTINRENIRSAKAADTYIFKGVGLNVMSLGLLITVSDMFR